MRLNYSKNKDKKVEFKTEKIPSSAGNTRRIFYRIKPSELSWWKRKYCNPWTRMYRALKFVGGTVNIFEFQDYHDLIFPLKTYGEVIDFLAEQKNIGDETEAELNASMRERIERGEEWPD